MTKVRWLVVVFVLILAALAIAGIVLYADGVEGPKIGGTMVAVVVSEVDVPTGTDLDQLIKNDQLKLILIPASNVVDGAITSVDQLRHRSTTVAVLAGEQIPAGWLKTDAERASS